MQLYYTDNTYTTKKGENIAYKRYFLADGEMRLIVPVVAKTDKVSATATDSYNEYLVSRNVQRRENLAKLAMPCNGIEDIMRREDFPEEEIKKYLEKAYK